MAFALPARIRACLLIAAMLCMAPLAGAVPTPIEAMLQQADAVRSSDPGKFQALLSQLNAESRLATPGQREQLDYLNAYAHAYAGRYDLAIVETQKLIDSSTDAGSRLRAGSLMVNSYAATRQFTEGLRQLERNLLLTRQVDDKELRHHSLGVAAVLYNQVGQYRRALHYAEQMLADKPSPRVACFAEQFRLEAQYNLSQLPADDAPINHAIGRCDALAERTMANFIRILIARKWASEGRRGQAIALLQKYLAEVEATRYPRLVGEVNSLLAELLLANGNAEKAEQHALAAVAQSRSSEFLLPLVIAYRTLYEIDLQRHRPEDALRRYRQYADADKAYLNEVKTRELAYQIVRQETLQKSQEIELLDRKNQVLQLQQRVNEQKAQTSQLLILLLVLLLTSIAYWAFKVKRVQMSLRRMAQTDALTGICNRHHFSQQAEAVLQQCARNGDEVALIMFDLDHFKSVNDRFGHTAGDWVLRRVAETCKGFCRRIDHIGRLGGEEFAILLSACDLRAAVRVAQDCRVRIASIDTQPSEYKFVVTASFGVSASSLSGYDLAKLLSHADLMLYRAKREGRNRVCMFDGGLGGGPLPVQAADAAASELPALA